MNLETIVTGGKTLKSLQKFELLGGSTKVGLNGGQLTGKNIGESKARTARPFQICEMIR